MQIIYNSNRPEAEFMVRLLKAAHKLDQRPNYGVRFLSPYHKGDLLVRCDPFVGNTSDQFAVFLSCLGLSVYMTVAEGKVALEYLEGHFRMHHVVKATKFDPERILLHFERNVVAAREQTKEFIRNTYKLPSYIWPWVWLDITSTGAVRISMNEDFTDKTMSYSAVVSMDELDRFPLLDIANRLMSGK